MFHLIPTSFSRIVLCFLYSFFLCFLVFGSRKQQVRSIMTLSSVFPTCKSLINPSCLYIYIKLVCAEFVISSGCCSFHFTVRRLFIKQNYLYIHPEDLELIHLNNHRTILSSAPSNHHQLFITSTYITSSSHTASQQHTELDTV